ncbi:MAG: argininosuccinate lyase [Promethearchaeota archaeon]
MGKDIYRTRLKAPLNKDVLEFISCLKEDLWIAEEDIIGTEVHNIMLFEQDIISKNEIKKILTSLENIKYKLLNNQLDLEENYEDIHPFIEKCVIDQIGIDIGGKIHTGRSRNDQISVDIRLKIRSELNFLSKILFIFSNVLLDLSKKTVTVFIPLYTHLQRAQLGVFAHYLNNYVAQILRSLERVEEVYKRNNRNPLGACAVGGTSININRKRTAELLGFDEVIENSLDAISSKDYIYETLMCLSLISIQFSRISEDLLIWSSKEFNFVELDDQYCSVSSVMPQKKNPDTLELIRSKSSKIISNLFTASMIVKGIPSGYFKDFQDLKMLLKNSFELLFSITKMFIGIFSTIKINRNTILNNINESFILTLDLAELLVQKYKIPFRQSHKIVAKLVKGSKNPQDLLNREKIEKEILKVEKKKILIAENFVESLKDLNFCLENRISQGSPSKKEVERVINSLNENKNKLYDFYLKRVKKVDNARYYRENLIKKLIS